MLVQKAVTRCVKVPIPNDKVAYKIILPPRAPTGQASQQRDPWLLVFTYARKKMRLNSFSVYERVRYHTS